MSPHSLSSIRSWPRSQSPRPGTTTTLGVRTWAWFKTGVTVYTRAEAFSDGVIPMRSPAPASSSRSEGPGGLAVFRRPHRTGIREGNSWSRSRGLEPRITRVVQLSARHREVASLKISAPRHAILGAEGPRHTMSAGLRLRVRVAVERSSTSAAAKRVERAPREAGRWSPRPPQSSPPYLTVCPGRSAWAFKFAWKRSPDRRRRRGQGFRAASFTASHRCEARGRKTHESSAPVRSMLMEARAGRGGGDSTTASSSRARAPSTPAAAIARSTSTPSGASWPW